MHTHTVKNIRMKDGTTVPALTYGTVEFSDDTLCLFRINFTDRVVRLSWPTAVLCLDGFDPVPDIETLEAWSHDGVCETVLGNCVEPDGHDEHGAPSWLLALGMI